MLGCLTIQPGADLPDWFLESDGDRGGQVTLAEFIATPCPAAITSVVRGGQLKVTRAVLPRQKREDVAIAHELGVDAQLEPVLYTLILGHPVQRPDLSDH